MCCCFLTFTFAAYVLYFIVKNVGKCIVNSSLHRLLVVIKIVVKVNA